ncbi:MAG: hypothetical protein J7K20_01520, partial [Thermodesulfobacterium sp.]|nr:hypothetical protein [Thermodesulfobacterium sp.]
MRKIWITLFFFIGILQFHSLKAETIVVIDKGRKILELKEGEKVIALYEAGFGLKSYLPKEKKGDFLTPEGLYQIVDIRTSEKYKYFLELNYPNL